ncbi:MAG: hypothetical protein ACJASL_002480 [Paraglaciecola sp.]|jgi:hypothetical protein
MTAIKLLEKLGADATFDPSLLSLEDKKTLEDIIQKAQIFNAVEIVYAPDEEEEEDDDEEDDDSEKEKTS